MRTPRINDCGHPERKHKAKGMCEPCYRKIPTQHYVRAARCRKRHVRRYSSDAEYKTRRLKLFAQWWEVNGATVNARKRALRAAKKAAKEISTT